MTTQRTASISPPQFPRALQSILALLACTITTGCGTQPNTSDTDSAQTSITVSSDTVSSAGKGKYWGPPPAETGRNWKGNLYTVDNERYHGYGIVLCDAGNGDLTDDRKTQLLKQSAERIRADFGEHFLAQTIYTYDPHNTLPDRWTTENSVFAMFVPTWVAVILCDKSADHNDADGYSAGIVIKSSDLFESSTPFNELITSAFRAQHPVHIDSAASRPGHRLVFDIIENHRRHGVVPGGLER